MAAEKQLKFDSAELLDNIHYVNQSNEHEIKRLNDLFRLRFAGAELSGNTVDSIIDEVSNQLGQLSGKVNLAEQAINSIRLKQKHKTTAATAKSESANNEAGLQFSISQLVGNKNLLPMETNCDGIDYAWSGADPETQFTFSLDRRKKLGMQIRLVSLIKQEYPDLLKLFIDGTHIQHSLSMDGNLFMVSCNLPPSSNAGQTEVKIVLPATHRPMDLGNSGDGRKLGMAINEIRFGKPVSRFGLFLERIKSKS